jgi:hypothetical protein
MTDGQFLIAALRREERERAMQMSPVKSTNIDSVGHDAATKTLRVKFKSGAIYDYADVPSDHHTKMLAAESPGTHLNTEIKGKFKHTRVEE